MHPVTSGLRGLGEEQLKINFLEHQQKKDKRKRTLSFPKQEVFLFVLSREALPMTFTTGFLKQMLKSWQHLCLQVKSHGGVYVNWTPHVLLPALNGHPQPPRNASPFLHNPLTIQPYKAILLRTPSPVRNLSSFSFAPVW